jgi:hypothetical protein
MSLPCGSIFPGSGVERPERRRWQGHEGEQRTGAGSSQPERAAWQRTIEQEHGGCLWCVFVGVLEQPHGQEHGHTGAYGGGGG